VNKLTTQELVEHRAIDRTRGAVESPPKKTAVTRKKKYDTHGQRPKEVFVINFEFFENSH
jgi:hypothetical protein